MKPLKYIVSIITFMMISTIPAFALNDQYVGDTAEDGRTAIIDNYESADKKVYQPTISEEDRESISSVEGYQPADTTGELIVQPNDSDTSITADRLVISFYLDGVNRYDYVLEKGDGYVLDTFVPSGKYTLYKLSSPDDSETFSLSENSFVLQPGGRQILTINPPVDIYELNGVQNPKNISEEEKQQIKESEYQEAVQDEPMPNIISDFVERNWENGTLQWMIMIAICFIVLIVYYCKHHKKIKRDFSFDS